MVLLTLSGFVEWVAMTHIMAHEGKMLQILCLLLKNEVFQTPAAECLLQVILFPHELLIEAPNLFDLFSLSMKTIQTKADVD